MIPVPVAEDRIEGPIDDPTEDTDSVDARPSVWGRFARRFWHNRVGVAALVFLVLITLATIAAPLIAPDDPLAQDLSNALQSPSSGHLLGTDELGRDVLSRLLYGGRISLAAAALVVVLAGFIGIAPGLVAGYLGGFVDRFASLITDAVMSIPPLILALGVIAVLGPGLLNAMIPVAIIFAPRFVRIVRGSVIGVKHETYVQAARSIGMTTPRIIWHHVLPNVAAPTIVQASVVAGFAMLAEAGLSYLGLGVQPPAASWGAMIGSASRVVSRDPLLIVWPGLCVTACVLAFSVLGDALRDALGRDER